jgi:2-polyprenyl-6-methoxyphenol hydroxylase-like FAD-dependent oxidoreductase
MESRTRSTVGDRAIVIGGSMAGLLTARVLSDHFDEVTVIERDRFSDEPAFRKGVPQSHHAHALLQSGALVLDKLFPGLERQLTAAGAVRLQSPKDFLWLTAAGWSHRFEGRHQALSCSRPLLEWTVRERVLGGQGVSVREGCEVSGLVPNANGSAITGVRLRPRGIQADAAGPQGQLLADFVFDASGRTSRASGWLEALGYPVPRQTRIDAFLGYASRLYTRPSRLRGDWKAILLQAQPPGNGRSGVLLPIEGNRWLITLGGAGRDYPPTDEVGFLEFARGLRSPILHDALKDAEPASPIWGYRRTENQRRHYERLRSWPERFAVVGDAACAFNPVYGQGMSVAANTAAALGQLLEAGHGVRLDGLARDFQRQVARCNAAAWLIATGVDLRYPTTEGTRPGLERLLNRYLDRVTEVANADADVNAAFLDVYNLLSPPESLFRPGILLPVLRRRGGRGPKTAPSAGGALGHRSLASETAS